jgi:putative tryptophan/tyrosine transport system substrate-binding protein
MNQSKKNGMARKIWVFVTFIVLAALLLSGCGTQQQAKVYHVGILSDGGSFAAIGDGFKAQMTKLGYTEGQNITYDMQNANADPAKEKSMAKQLVDEKVDLIFTFPVPPTVAAYSAAQGTNIPVVFAYYQTEGSNLVKSVQEPGGNITGVRYPGPELISRRLQLLHEIAPQVRRVWVGYDKNGPNMAVTLAALRPAAASLGVTLVEVPATTQGDLGIDLATRATSADLGLDAILTMPDSFNTSPAGFAVLSNFAAAHNLPLVGGLASQAQQGALFINGTDFNNVGELAAPLADKVLKGIPAGTIPVVTPEQTLIINYKVAQALNLTVPSGLLSQANQVIH